MSSPLGIADRRIARRFTQILLLGAVVFSTTGCRYISNRYYDARDVFNIGVGVTRENPITGFPPALGVYLEATEFLHLGWITFNGAAAEMELRGTFVGPEYMTRAGFLWWQRIRKNQVYPEAFYHNAFKDRDFPWTYRMEGADMRLHGIPAKSLHYERWAEQTFEGTWLRHRGWQYWGYLGASVAISEPFITHHGLMIRFGVDFSEIFDFVGGILLYDFREDDMTRTEYEYFRNPETYRMEDNDEM